MSVSGAECPAHRALCYVCFRPRRRVWGFYCRPGVAEAFLPFQALDELKRIEKFHYMHRNPVNESTKLLIHQLLGRRVDGDTYDRVGLNKAIGNTVFVRA